MQPQSTKMCTACQQEKPLDDFPRNAKRPDGRYSMCKACKNQRGRERHASRPDRAPSKTPAARREWRRNNPDIVSAQRKRYRGRYPERLNAESRVWMRKNPEKHTAHSTLYAAVTAGKIARPDRCSICNRECKPDGHHEDYTRPLDVIWLCQRCHAQLHAERRVRNSVDL